VDVVWTGSTRSEGDKGKDVIDLNTNGGERKGKEPERGFVICGEIVRVRICRLKSEKGEGGGEN